MKKLVHRHRHFHSIAEAAARNNVVQRISLGVLYSIKSYRLHFTVAVVARLFPKCVELLLRQSKLKPPLLRLIYVRHPRLSLEASAPNRRPLASVATD